MAIGHHEALALTAPMSVDPDEPLFDSKPKAAVPVPKAPDPTARVTVGAKPELSKPPPAAAVELSGNPLWAIPLSRLTASSRWPLFAPTRQPPPVAAVAKPPSVLAPPPKPAEPETPQLSLLGTVAGAEKIGLFMDQANKAVVRLRAGENHKGWILRSVSPRQVEFARGLDTAVLELPPPNMKASGAPPPLPNPALAGAPPGNPALPVSTGKAAGAPPMPTPASEPPPGLVNPFAAALRGSAR